MTYEFTVFVAPATCQGHPLRYTAVIDAAPTGLHSHVHSYSGACCSFWEAVALCLYYTQHSRLDPFKPAA